MVTPTPRECAKTQISVLREEACSVKTTNGTVMKMHRFYACPRGDRCDVKELRCQKSAVFSNPYRHLLRCFRREQGAINVVIIRKEVPRLYHGDCRVRDSCQSDEHTTERERAIYA